MNNATACIVVPCFNEARRLNPESLLTFALEHRNVHFVMVDDGSTDSTAEILSELQSLFPESFEFLTLADNSGKAEAVRQGLLHAIGGGAEFVGYWDADLATPLSTICEFHQVLMKNDAIDVVLGCRIQGPGHDIRRPLIRATLGRLFARAASFVLRMHLFDTQCGAKLFRVTEDLKVAIQDPFTSRWIFDVELLARLSKYRSSRAALFDAIYQMPLRRWHEQAGSKLRPWHFVNAGIELSTIYFNMHAPAASTNQNRREALELVMGTTNERAIDVSRAA
ncbi:MAG TPA: glycosyltransferase [Pirellulaceae bacterium]|nr:glycosyltransferase [Pirellulaceae bacterium]HMO92443.1 glycosyltransferase [Pirellulaceae bacterium]HMP67887.1 glycosyltransferase [Pirellulaceae bacterium]